MSDRLAEFRAFRERMNTRILNVGLIVGGSIVIPHLRRAVDMLDRLNAGEGPETTGHAEHGA